jgi:hypothetical protein
MEIIPQNSFTGGLLADFRHFQFFGELPVQRLSSCLKPFELRDRGLPKLSSKGFKLDLTLGQLPQAINSIFDCTVCSQSKTEFIACGG